MRRCVKCGTSRRKLSPDNTCAQQHEAVCKRRSQTWPTRRRELESRKPAKA